LEQGNTVLGINVIRCVDNGLQQPSRHYPGYTFMEADLRDFEVVLKGYDTVVNLAAHRNPGDYKVATHKLFLSKRAVLSIVQSTSNVVISWNILRACAEVGITRVDKHPP